MNAGELIKQAKASLVAANERFGYKGGEEDQAWDLLIHAWGQEPGYDDLVPPRVRQRFKRLVARRAKGEPMAYIVGWIDFRDFRLAIKPGVFVPRATSEFLAEQAIRRLRARRAPVHLDLATGIGPVAVASARSLPHARVLGLDLSRRALSLARMNAAALGLGNLTFMKSDLFSGAPRSLRGLVDVVTIHPPYVAAGELGSLVEEIREYEPRQTLTDGSEDGLGLVRRVAEEGVDWIRPGGWLLIEVTPSEFRAIRTLLKSAGYTDIRSTHGSMRYTRVITGRL
ncbi:MAG: peptide chain release factor N(5)-glutamine methyltransferase [Thermoleophilia bacterium]|nr:peptide chain release factor N(5)-glutamine methyltransferase [Thermoleophilia bacterium]